MNRKNANNDNRFNVFVRVRPFIEEDQQLSDDEEQESIIRYDRTRQKLILQKANFEDKLFQFDHVFDDKTQQDYIYINFIDYLIEDVFQGYNGTLIAYGQTGSGKTHTIFGSKLAIEQLQSNDYISPDVGIVFRALDQIFQRIEKLLDIRQFLVNISVMELYMENIIDLLNTATKQQKDQNLQIREDPYEGLFINGLTQKSIKNCKEAYQIIKEAVKYRMNSQTIMNKSSSRSHALIQITVEQRWIEVEDQLIENNLQQKKVAVLTIVDLAGSERLSKTFSDGARLEEAKVINKSISALGNCIAALAKDNRKNKVNNPFNQSHIPFRDSKLTRILSESLCGNSKTSIIACISPSMQNYDETFSTLLFASRAMQISVDAKKKEDIYFKQSDLVQQQIQQFYLNQQDPESETAATTDVRKQGIEKQRSENTQRSRSRSKNKPDPSQNCRTPSSFNTTIIDPLAEETQKLREEVEFLKMKLEKHQFYQDSNPQSSSQLPTGNTSKLKEQELFYKYEVVIEYLQEQLTKKNAKIFQLEKDLQNYKLISKSMNQIQNQYYQQL